MAPTQAQAAPVENVDRRTRLTETINSLIQLRQEMYVSYCQLAGVSTFDRRMVEQNNGQSEQLRSFCQLMVDYTAMGHFEVYQRIIDGQERRVAVKEVAAKVYPGIADTTNFLVDFNDKYVDFQGTEQELDELDTDLSKLGEVIAVRGDLEDQILAALAAKKEPR